LAIFFQADYARLCEGIEGGKAEVFEYESALGRVRHLFIKRAIPQTEYYDLITPFRYGGPFIKSCPRGNRQALVGEFEAAFAEYCEENGIVSEFVRFHPLFNNGADFKTCYQVRLSRKTVGTDLKGSSNPVQDEFSKSARNNIKRALNKGITCRVQEKPKDLGSLKHIYYETLKRNKASSFHYFPAQYFSDCVKLFRQNIVLIEAFYEGKTTAAGLCFTFGKVIHVHLSGTLTEFLPLSPAYLLRWALTEWGKDCGYHVIHHGGGLGAGKNDSLYRFKGRFGSLRFDYKIGEKIWNKEIYEKLCSKAGKIGSRFPAYR